MADVETTIVGAVWVRIMDDYGHVEETEEEDMGCPCHEIHWRGMDFHSFIR